jgi:eukaryotic-like serine/threonine-protein kinase
LFGSMILFMFTGAAMTAQIATHLDPTMHWNAWRGNYTDALLFLRSAMGRVIEDFKAKAAAGKATDDLAVAIGELCEPDPALRGHPHNRAGRGARYSVERYVSLLNLHAGQAEYDLKRSAFGNRR